MVTVECQGRLPSGISKAFIGKLANAAYARAGGRGGAVISVSVVNDAAMRRLNRRFRGKDKATDVLSFGYDAETPKGDSPFLGKKGQVRQLGDIVIALPQVRRNARKIGRSVRAEFALMVVHGTLHLMGYDHETVKDEKKMFGLQHEILLRIGVI